MPKKQKIENLYKKYKNQLYRYLRANFPRLANEDSFDVLQEVWKTLTENIDAVEKLEEKQQVFWLYKTTEYRARKILGRKYYSDESLSGRESLVEGRADETSPLEKVIRKMVASDIIDGLKEKDRELLIAKMCGVSFAELQTEKYSVHSLECRYSRMMKKLKKRMEEEGL